MDNLRKGFNFLGKIWKSKTKKSKGGGGGFKILIFFCSIEMKNGYYHKIEHTFAVLNNYVYVYFRLFITKLWLFLKCHFHFSGGVIIRKVLGLEIFYSTQLVFRGKQPYITNLIEIPDGVVAIFHFFGWPQREWPP